MRSALRLLSPFFVLGLSLLAAFPTAAEGQSFRRWLDDGKTFTCSTVSGGVNVFLSNQNVEFANLPADAEFTINYIKNGVIETDGPFTVEQTSGTRSYGPFSTDFPAYPLTFDFRLDTLIDGIVVYHSSVLINCAGDSTGPVQIVNSLPSVVEVPALSPRLLAALAGLMALAAVLLLRHRA